MLIHRAPEIVQDAIDAQVHFIEVPDVARLRLASAQLAGEACLLIVILPQGAATTGVDRRTPEVIIDSRQRNPIPAGVPPDATA